MSDEMLLVINPVSGRGRGELLHRDVEALLRSLGVRFTSVETEYPGHAVELAQQAVEDKFRAVVAVGGDGTVNEVLNGLVTAGSNGTALGVVPVGSGNDFAFGSGIPLEWREACKRIAEGRLRRVDVGLVESDADAPRYFGNGVGVGFDAVVNVEALRIRRGKYTRWAKGMLLYLFALLRTFFLYYAAPRVRVRCEEREWDQPTMMISVMNGPRFGGGFLMTPGARMDDGRLELCVARKVPRPMILPLIVDFIRGTHIRRKPVELGYGRQVEIEAEEPFPAHVDGEVYGLQARHYRISLFPQHLTLLG